MTDLPADIPAPIHRQSAVAQDDVHAHDDHGHPAESAYWKIFLFLVVLTAVEVAWSYGPFEGPSLVVPLLLMMVVKFLVVGGAFMHLYYDLNFKNGYWFALMFGTAILLAIAVYLIVFATFSFQI